VELTIQLHPLPSLRMHELYVHSPGA
jgi:hypothetical protein